MDNLAFSCFVVVGSWCWTADIMQHPFTSPRARPGVVRRGPFHVRAGRHTRQLNLCVVFCLFSVVRPHLSNTYIDVVYCYKWSSVACVWDGRSVCHNHEPAKIAELMDMSFGMWTWAQGSTY